jgi:DNA repair exonuclease SbcCD ATPase subunit
MSDKKKVEKKAAPASETAVEAPAPAVEKKETARDIIYSPEQIEEIGNKLNELVETLPVVRRERQRPAPKNTAREVIKKFYPQIKALMDKGYSKKYIHEFLTTNQLMNVQIFTFMNALKSYEKKLQANVTTELEMEIKTGNNIPDMEVNGEDLEQAQADIDAFDSERELIEHPVQVPV